MERNKEYYENLDKRTKEYKKLSLSLEKTVDVMKERKL